MKTTLLAAALALSSTAAMADNTISLQYGTFDKEGSTLSGAVLTQKGSSGRLFTDSTFSVGEQEGFDVTTQHIRAHWSGLGYDTLNVGPAVAYQRESIEGFSFDTWSLGLGATATTGVHEARAYVMAPVEDTEYWSFDASLDTQLGARTTLLQTYSFQKSIFSDQHTYTVGARHDLTPKVYVEGNALIERSFDTTGTGVSGGVGFRF